MFVVFVDQDQRALADIERNLATLGCDWEIEFASSPRTALAIVESRPVDVVITDQRLPLMHGATLLREVRTLRPETVRILLTNEPESDAALRALDAAHRTMCKPCNTEELVEVTDRILSLRDILKDDRLRELFGAVTTLPAAPTMYLSLSQALDDPDSDSSRIATMMAKDPALSAKVLRLSNTAMYGGKSTIVDVRGAVTRLGLRTVRNLVLAAEAFKDHVPGGMDPAQLQMRATQASSLVPMLLDDPAEIALASTAALLSDLGWLLPAGTLTPSWSGQPTDVGAPPQPSHAEAGAYLLGLWGLPMSLVETVAFHHRPSASGEHCGAAGAVHIASALAAREPIDMEFAERTGMLDRIEQARTRLESFA